MSVTLKLATSLDGRIATASGESRWITGEAARTAVHRLRAEHDAVVVGIQTAIADDPELTVRLDGHAGAQPARVVLDSRQRLAPGARLVRTAQEIPTYLVALGPPDPVLAAAGVRILQSTAGADGRPALVEVVRTLANIGLRRLMVEGGGQAAAGFLRCGLVDRIEWFRAPIILGDEGRPCIGGLRLERLSEAWRYRRVSVEAVGDDSWERFERTGSPP